MLSLTKKFSKKPAFNLLPLFSTIFVLLAALLIVGLSNLAMQSRDSSINFLLKGGDNLGVVIDSDLEVKDVVPNGSADVAGLEVGDKLVSLDDVPFTSGQQANEMVRQKLSENSARKRKGEALEPFDFVVSRDGQLLQLQVEQGKRRIVENKGNSKGSTATPVPSNQHYF